MTPDLTAKVLRLLDLRKEVDWIASTYNVPRAHIVKLGLDVGMRFDPHHDVMTRTPVAITEPRPGPEPFTVPAQRGNDQDRFTAPARVPVQRSAPTPAQEQAMTGAVAIPSDADQAAGQLLASTAEYRDKIVVRIRRRILADLDLLHARVLDVAAAESRARQVDREKAILRARADKLRADLADLERQLGKKPKATSPTSGPSTADVRTWALANNVPCSAHGRAPQSAIDAYVAAHPDVAAGAA